MRIKSLSCWSRTGESNIASQLLNSITVDELNKEWAGMGKITAPGKSAASARSEMAPSSSSPV